MPIGARQPGLKRAVGRARNAMVAVLLTGTLSACATDRPIAFQCTRMNEFRTEVPVTPGGPIPGVPVNDLASVLSDAFAPRPGGAVEGPVNVVLLSGGGKWGAYGAGLLKAWSAQTELGQIRPRFDVVTGVSTGALQSTFAFLGRQYDDRLIAAYTIENERQLAIRHGGSFFIRHASMADLSPLREYARKRVVPLLDEVATEGRSGRKLFVGSIDALNGKMYAIDMTLSPCVGGRWPTAGNGS